MRRGDLTVPLLWLSVILVGAGIGLSLLGFRVAIIAAGLGFLLFVGVAWLAARPTPRRSVSGREVNPPWPWGPDPNLIDFADRLREEAESAENLEKDRA